MEQVETDVQRPEKGVQVTTLRSDRDNRSGTRPKAPLVGRRRNLDRAENLLLLLLLLVDWAGRGDCDLVYLL